MNNRNKGFSIILYFIWPFSAVLIGIKNFDSRFARNLIIGAFGFLGFTAEEAGDLIRYAASYYDAADNKPSHLFDLFLNLQIGKFFNDFTAILFSVFDSHNIYFAFLFGFYGYFLVNAVNLLRVRVLKKSNAAIIIGFITFAFFYSVLTVFNYAFYTGAIYFLYFLLQIIFNETNKKYYLLILLTPLFHLGLTPLLIIPLAFLLFGQRTRFYLLLLILFTLLSQSFFVENLGDNLSKSETVLDKKYNAYASNEGRERMDTRYSEGYESGSFNYRIFRDIRKVANNLAIPLLLFVLFINRKQFKEDNTLLKLFNLSIASMAVTNLMLNISQGERFFLISGFMILATYAYYIQKNNYKNLKYKFLLFLIIPSILLNNIVSLYLVKNLISPDFLLSNFPYLLFKLL